MPTTAPSPPRLANREIRHRIRNRHRRHLLADRAAAVPSRSNLLRRTDDLPGRTGLGARSVGFPAREDVDCACRLYSRHKRARGAVAWRYVIRVEHAVGRHRPAAVVWQADTEQFAAVCRPQQLPRRSESCGLLRVPVVRTRRRMSALPVSAASDVRRVCRVRRRSVRTVADGRGRERRQCRQVRRSHLLGRHVHGQLLQRRVRQVRDAQRCGFRVHQAEAR